MQSTGSRERARLSPDERPARRGAASGTTTRRRPDGSVRRDDRLPARRPPRARYDAPEPTVIGRFPRVVLALVLLVALVGVARATDVVSLIKASSRNPTAVRIVGTGQPAPTPATAPAAVAPLGQLRSADVLLTADHPIPATTLADIKQLPGIAGTESFRYGTVDLAGNKVPTYGVNPSTFRNWAVRATAASDAFWSSLAGGEASTSFQTGKDLNLPLGARMPLTARTSQVMRLGSFATVGLPDAEAVLSDDRAAALGLPAGSGLLISAPSTDLRVLTGTLRAIAPGVAVRPLKPLPPAPTSAPVPMDEPSASASPPADTASPLPTIGGLSGGIPSATSSGSSTPMTSGPASASAQRVIDIAKSKIGSPYVYGANGPNSFDCSGLTQWTFGQVGIGLPRTAQEQWLSGPHVSYANAQPGDILAWAGDPNAPGYVTHVAIYLGNGQMISAPHTGTTVSISSVYTSGLLGAVHVLS